MQREEASLGVRGGQMRGGPVCCTFAQGSDQPGRFCTCPGGSGIEAELGDSPAAALGWDTLWPASWVAPAFTHTAL